MSTNIFNKSDMSLTKVAGLPSMSSIFDYIKARLGLLTTNPNLLDNPFFSINSRGQTSYTVNASSSEYCVDRWKVNRCMITPTTNGAKIKKVSGANNCFISQYVPYDGLVEKTLDASYIIDGKQYNHTFIVSDTLVYQSSAEDNCYLVVTADSISKTLWLGIYVTDDVERVYTCAKLELGTVSTLEYDTVPDYATEYIKCITSKADASDTYANKPVNFASNENLLDNPFFTVNSRGQTTYTINKDNIYTVDRWKFDFPGTLTVSNGITCTPSAGAYIHKIYQIIPNSVIKSLIGKRLTISANISIRNGYVRLMKKSELASVTTSDTHNIPISYTTDVSLFSASFNLTSDYDGTEDYILLVAFHSTTTPATIKNIKLEYGSVSTLSCDNVPNYSSEYIKCITSKADASDTYANKPINFASNENLLDNAWFTVNQRNSTSASTSYGFDRWIGVYSISGSTLVMANGNYTIQALDENLKASLDRKTITLSVLYSDGTIESGKATYSKNPSDWISPIISNRIYGQIQVNTGNVAITALASINIKAIKLEIGSVSTIALDIAPNYETELLKCQTSKASSTDVYSNGSSIRNSIVKQKTITGTTSASGNLTIGATGLNITPISFIVTNQSNVFAIPYLTNGNYYIHIVNTSFGSVANTSITGTLYFV